MAAVTAEGCVCVCVQVQSVDRPDRDEGWRAACKGRVNGGGGGGGATGMYGRSRAKG